MRQTANTVNITIQQCLARGMICSQLHRTVIAASSNTFSKILPSSICTIPQFQILIIQLSNMSLAKIKQYASQAHLGSHFDTVFVWLLLSVADSSFVVVTDSKQYYFWHCFTGTHQVTNALCSKTKQTRNFIKIHTFIQLS